MAQNQCEKQSVVAYTFNLSTGEVETGKPWGSLASLPSLTSKLQDSAKDCVSIDEM